MAYLPLSQIKSNLYTKGGEFLSSSTLTEYKGYYYITSKGECFTGKNPQNPPNDLLIKNLEEFPELSDPNTPTTKPSFWTISEPKYQKVLLSPPSSPTSYYPKVTKKEYKLGEFERYFLSKNNEIKFKEVNLFTYNQYLTKDPSVSFQLFSPIKLSWELIGNREKTYTINYNTVKRISLNLKLRGFVEYFQGRFTQFYKEIGD